MLLLRCMSPQLARNRPSAMAALPPLSGGKRTYCGHVATAVFDPYVWSGRASQEVFVDLADAVLHQCIRPLMERIWLQAIMDISARATSLRDRPRWAKWVTSARTRREDRSSISSHPLADLGG
jgi:hypothetical protein